MKLNLKFSNPWKWSGTIGRGEFLIWGIFLFAVKYNLDRLLSWVWFQKPLTLFDPQQARQYLWQSLPSEAEGPQLLAMLALSIPFLYAGVVLTLRRLRALGWRPWLVALFFVPLFKFVFFVVLCLMPSRPEAIGIRPAQRERDWLRVIIPRGAMGSVAVALLFSILTTVAAVWFGTNVLHEYGWALFIGLPFVTPLMAVLMHSFHERRTLRTCLGIANSVVILAGMGLMLFAMEGIICILMAAPLAFAVASIAGVAGYLVQDTFWWPEGSARQLCIALLAIPATMSVEHAAPPPLPLLEVKSSVVVNAPPERVWKNVVAFSELPPPREWIFRLGVAYPMRARIFGQGAGAVRHCNFSTGAFVEPIQTWDEPRLLKFSVTSNPAPMQEWTPYRHVHPPHLDGYLQSKGGQFRLERLDGGRTLLEGTTWYHHRLWPARYWQVWSDLIIHQIHQRVLDHVKQLSEESTS